MRSVYIYFLLAGAIAGSSFAAGEAGKVKAGLAVADITPDLTMTMPGGFTPRPVKGVHDKLLAVALVIHDGTNAVALVGTDSLFIGEDCVKMARDEIQKAAGITPDNVLVGASHTHTGGPILSCLGNEADPVYVERVTRAIVAAVTDAHKALQPAEIGAGIGKESTISFNRRFIMKNGKEVTHPGRPGTPNHDQIVRPAGPIDPDVGVLAVRKPGGAVFGVVVNFACHATAGGSPNDEISADYIAYLRKNLQLQYGENVPVVFFQSPCGDITQVDNMSAAKQSGPEYCNFMGMKLASEAIRTIGRMKWENDLTVAAVRESVPVAIRPEPDINAERQGFGGGGEAIDKIYVEECKKVAAERAKTPIINCEVQGLRIGSLGIATNGAEFFVEYGLRIKEASPFKLTWVVSLANQYIGYVPTAQAMVSGGYEPRMARSSKLVPEAGQRIVETALKALNRVKPDEKK